MTLRNPKRTIDELIAAKLWHHSGRTCTSCLAQRTGKKVLGDVPSGGYVIHHYFDYQKPAWVIRQEREQRVEAGRRGGSSKGRKGSDLLSEPLGDESERGGGNASESLNGPLSEMPSEPLERVAKRAVLSEMPNPVPRNPYPVPVAIATRTPARPPGATGADQQADRGTKELHGVGPAVARLQAQLEARTRATN